LFPFERNTLTVITHTAMGNFLGPPVVSLGNRGLLRDYTTTSETVVCGEESVLRRRTPR